MCPRIALPVDVGVSEEGARLVEEVHGVAVGSQMAEQGLVGPRAQGHSGEADHHLAVRAAERWGTVWEHPVKVVPGEPGDWADKTACDGEMGEVLRPITGVKSHPGAPQDGFWARSQ